MFERLYKRSFEYFGKCFFSKFKRSSGSKSDLGIYALRAYNSLMIVPKLGSDEAGFINNSTFAVVEYFPSIPSDIGLLANGLFCL